MRTPTSTRAAELFGALGATADDLDGARLVQALANGTAAGAESSYAWAPSLLRPGIATGNVTFFPKVNALVVNADAFAGLDAEQRELLEEAAARTRSWAIAAAPTDAEAAKAYCARGGTVVLASDADVAALEAAVRPVYARLEQDPRTKSLIDRIRELKAEVAAPSSSSVAGCRGASAGGASAGAPVGAAARRATAFPEGVYRAELPTRVPARSGACNRMPYTT